MERNKMDDKDLVKVRSALDRLKSISRNPRGYGDYGCWTDALGLFNEDISSIERALSKYENASSALLKGCPICGAIPTLIEVDLDRGNGHGYPGDYSYHYECGHCKMVKSSGGDTVYSQGVDKKESAKAEAVRSWHEKVKQIEGYLEKQWERRL